MFPRGNELECFLLAQPYTVFLKNGITAEQLIFHVAGLPFVSLGTFRNSEKMRIDLNHFLSKMTS